jgi:hypothetical protein
MKTNTNDAATTKAPTHVAYQVKNREGKKAIWTRIGSAWAHSDGEEHPARRSADRRQGHAASSRREGRVGVTGRRGGHGRPPSLANRRFVPGANPPPPLAPIGFGFRIAPCNFHQARSASPAGSKEVRMRAQTLASIHARLMHDYGTETVNSVENISTSPDDRIRRSFRKPVTRKAFGRSRIDSARADRYSTWSALLSDRCGIRGAFARGPANAVRRRSWRTCRGGSSWGHRGR